VNGFEAGDSDGEEDELLLELALELADAEDDTDGGRDRDALVAGEGKWKNGERRCRCCVSRRY
jgi:hypothetical protein